MDKVNMAKNKNRRVFFRIYDEVNLFYKKIDEKSATELLNSRSLNNGIQPEGAALPLFKPDNNLPDAIMSGVQFNKSETCNINLSAGGLAFNCKDAFNEGDCLVIKILLASSMTVIEAPCEVVYCRSSLANDSDCPYFVGVHFIGMKGEDRALLDEYVDKKRLRRRWVNVAILIAVATVITLPDVVFGLLSEMLHFLFEMLLEFSHLAFEFIESNLDHLVEHLFETDVHQTQIIVFYIIVPFVFYGFYQLWCVVPPFCRRCKQQQIAYWSRKKANLLFYWREQSSLEKLKLIVISVAVIACYIFFGM